MIIGEIGLGQLRGGRPCAANDPRYAPLELPEIKIYREAAVAAGWWTAMLQSKSELPSYIDNLTEGRIGAFRTHLCALISWEMETRSEIGQPAAILLFTDDAPSPLLSYAARLAEIEVYGGVFIDKVVMLVEEGLVRVKTPRDNDYVELSLS